MRETAGQSVQNENKQVSHVIALSVQSVVIGLVQRPTMDNLSHCIMGTPTRDISGFSQLFNAPIYPVLTGLGGNESMMMDCS